MENNVKKLNSGANPLGTESIGKLIMQFSIPAIVSNLVNAAYNLVDQVFIGNGIGLLGIAATNIAFPLAIITAAIGYLLGTGGAANFSLRLGAGNKEAADRYAGNMLCMMAISGLSLGAAALIFARPLVFAFGATEATKTMALSYMSIIAIGMPFGIFTIGASALIRADGSPKYAMICMLSGAIFNLIFDPVFMFLFGWGIKGIAWATTLGQALTAGIAVYYFIERAKNVSLKKRYFRLNPHLLENICALGLTPCINQLAIAVMQIVTNNTLRYYGAASMYGSDIPLGGAGAVAKLSALFLAFAAGIAQGCQPIHGFNYGAKKYDRVKQTLRLALISAGVLSVTIFLLFQIFPRTLLIIFGENDPLYLEFAERYLRIFMFMIFLSGVQPIAATFFPAIGRAGRGVLLALTRQILLLLPLMLILPFFFGLDGVFYAGPGSDFGAACFSAWMIAAEIKKISALQRINI